MKRILMYLWQLPQNLLGLLLVKAYKAEPYYYYIGKEEVKLWQTPRIRGAVSLGDHIIINRVTRKTVMHERGHQVQSRRLGWLYLLTVGLVSGLRCGLHLYKNGHYYDAWPESEADRLGGVER